MTGTKRAVTRVADEMPEAGRGAELSESIVQLALQARTDPTGALDHNLRIIAGALPIIVFGLDRDGTYLWSYGGALGALGFEDDELVGQSVDVFGEEAAEAFRSVIAAGRPRMMRADGVNGESSWSITTVVAPLPDGAGVAAVALNTTSEVEAARAALHTEALFAAAVQAIDEGMVIQSDTGAIVRANARASTILGLEPDDLGPFLAERSGWRTIHEDGSPFLPSEFPGRQSLRLDRAIKRVTMGCISPAGQTFWLLINSFPVRLDQERVVVSTFSDITEQRATSAASLRHEQRFRMLSASAPIGIFLTDETQTITYANPELVRQTGLTLEEIQDRGWTQIVHPDDAKAVAAALRDFFEHDTPYVTEHRLTRPDGSVRWVRARLAHMATEHGETAGLVGTAADITDLVEADQRLRESEERTRAILESAAEGIITADENGTIIEFNAAAERILGYDSDEVVGRMRFDVMLDPALRPVMNQMFEDYLLRGQAQMVGEPASDVACCHKDGHLVPVEMAITEVVTSKGRLFTCVIHDISERKAFERQLEHQATHDALTGLPNQAMLIAELEAALNRAARHQGPKRGGVGVLFVGLGRMKVVTESLGHAAGDQVVIEAARRLTTAFADGGTATVTRFGGANLVLFAEDLDDVGDAVELATRVVAILDEPYRVGAEEAFITTAVGIAFAPAGMGIAESLVSNADVAMNRARSVGGAGFEIFDADMRRWVDQRRKLDVAMRHGLDRGEFELYYQPVMSIATGTIHGFEALVRWNHPELGVLSPIEFIPLAEDSGLIVPLGEAILRDACTTLARWQAERPEHDLKVSVNLSGRQLALPDLAATVARVLEETGAHARGLDLEITETVLLDDVEAAAQTLDALKAIGVNLAVDDFGTGYSSLTYLCRFPIDVVKVDKSFVSQLGTPSRDASIVSVVVGLAQTLQMAVVAEGVETAEQLRLLEELNCSYAQGYLFSEPRPLHQAEALLDGPPAEGERRG
jgi:PAS domain S-box-containing protein/diguanylate cyclase (GGDEF)-like protein